MFSTDDCGGGRYFAETCEGHSDRAAYKREMLISFAYYPSTYSECVIVRAVCGAYDQPTYVMCH